MRPFYTPHQLRHDQDDILFINEHWGEIKEAYFQVLEALKAPSVEQPNTPSVPTDLPYTERTFIPIYVYFKPDDILGDITDTEVTDLLKNTEAQVRLEFSKTYKDSDLQSTVKTLPLIYLDKTDEGFKYVVPYPLSLLPGMYVMRYTITIKLTDFTGYPYGIISTISTQIFKGRTVSEDMDVFNPTNKLSILLAKTTDTVNDPHLSIDELRKEHYLLANLEASYEDVYATFKFLETSTPIEFKELDNKEPASVLTPHTIKVRFNDDCWVDTPAFDSSEGNPKFGVYIMQTESGEGVWVEHSHIENGVVWFTFPEELGKTSGNYTAIFTRSDPNAELSWESKWNQTRDISIYFHHGSTEFIQYQAYDITKTEPSQIYVRYAYM